MEVVIIAGVLAIAVGWHVSRAHMSHQGIPIRRGQLHDYRRVRLQHGLRFAGLAIMLGLILLIVFH